MDGLQPTKPIGRAAANQLSGRLVAGHEIGGLDQSTPARILLRRQAFLVHGIWISAIREEQRGDCNGRVFIVGRQKSGVMPDLGATVLAS